MLRKNWSKLQLHGKKLKVTKKKSDAEIKLEETSPTLIFNYVCGRLDKSSLNNNGCSSGRQLNCLAWIDALNLK